MKKALIIFQAVVLSAMLMSGCGAERISEYSTPTATPVSAPISTAEPMTVPVPASAAVPVPTAVPVSTAVPAPAAASSPVPTPLPASPAPAAQMSLSTPSLTPAPTAAPKVKITKSPTDETLNEGGKAIFIAKADNATAMTWILVSPDAKTTYRLEDAPSYFTGLTTDGQGTEKIHLYNVPLSMDGWRIQCYFDGNGGPAYTSGAHLHISPSKTPDIFISSSPAGTSGTDGERAYEDAVGFAESVKRYADYCHFQASDIQNFTYNEGERYGECQITMTRGAVKLVCTLRSYLELRAAYPQTLIWYESEECRNTYTFGREDAESWNHLEKTMIDIKDFYGDGTAGQGMQFN